MSGHPPDLADYAGTTALVLGVSGFVGRHVAAALVHAGARVEGASRGATRGTGGTGAWGATLPAPGQHHALDLGQPGAVEALIRRIHPDVVFNLAAAGVNPDETDRVTALRINAELPGRVVRALADVPSPGAWQGPRLVHAGSAFEYGGAGGDLREDGPATPTAHYARTKLAGTRGVVEAGAEGRVGAVVARLFTVYGPGEAPHRLLPTLMRAASRDEPLSLTDGRQQRDFTFVGDVAQGLLRLGGARGGTPPVVNLACGQLTSVRSFAETAARILGIPADRLHFGDRPGRPDEMVHGPVTNALLRELTGWSPGTAVDEGIRRTAAAWGEG